MSKCAKKSEQVPFKTPLRDSNVTGKNPIFKRIMRKSFRGRGQRGRRQKAMQAVV